MMMNALHASIVLAVCALVVGCEPAQQQPQQEQQPQAEARPPAPGVVIDSLGMGAARVGMTLGELRAALPAGTRVGALDSLFMVDLVALPVMAGADTLYHLVFPAGGNIGDTTTLAMVVTSNPTVKTRAGVGPGMTARDAALVYGEPTFAYNINDESREYATFAGYPARNVRFRIVPNGDALFVGKYDTTAEYNETRDFDPAGRIFMVMVDLRSR